MHLAVIIKTEQRKELPTAAELREAGFAVSSAMGPDTGMDKTGGTLMSWLGQGPERERPQGSEHPDAFRNDRDPDDEAPGSLYESIMPRTG
jgi:hypothetical protein